MNEKAVAEQVEEQRPDQRGRRHLDGSSPGKGQYLPVVSVTLRPDDIEELEEIGAGNRSAAVRLLLEMYRKRIDEADPAA